MQLQIGAAIGIICTHNCNLAFIALNIKLVLQLAFIALKTTFLCCNWYLLHLQLQFGAAIDIYCTHN